MNVLKLEDIIPVSIKNRAGSIVFRYKQKQEKIDERIDKQPDIKPDKVLKDGTRVWSCDAK